MPRSYFGSAKTACAIGVPLWVQVIFDRSDLTGIDPNQYARRRFASRLNALSHCKLSPSARKLSGWGCRMNLIESVALLGVSVALLFSVVDAMATPSRYSKNCLG